MTAQTRWRLISLAGAVVAFAGYGIRDFNWPAELMRYSAALMGGGGAALLIGLANAGRALNNRRDNAR